MEVVAGAPSFVLRMTETKALGPEEETVWGAVSLLTSG